LVNPPSGTQVPERAEVAQALADLVSTRPSPMAEQALILWATKDQAEALIKIVKTTDLGNDRRSKAMEALARLKIEHAIEPIIDKLQGFDRQFAKKALQVYGKDAEKYLIPRVFDKNGEIRQEVQALLKEINTPTDKLVPEAIKAAGDRD